MEKSAVVNESMIVIILGMECKERILEVCIQHVLVLFHSFDCLDRVCFLSSGIKPFNNFEPLTLLELRIYGVTIMCSHSTNLPQFSCLFYDLS